MARRVRKRSSFKQLRYIYLVYLLLLLVVISFAIAIPRLIKQLNASKQTSEISNFTITLGAEEPGFPNLPDEKLGSYPDTVLSVIKDTSGVRMWLSSEVRSYSYSGPDLEHLTPQARYENGRPLPVFAPPPVASGSSYNGTNFESDHRGFGTVFEGPNQGQLVGVYHAERCDRNNFTATVGVATSTDGGVTWTGDTPLITGLAEDTSCEKTTPRGAGQPAALKVGNEIYIYYTDWSEGVYPDQIFLARIPFSDITNSANYSRTCQKWYNGSFSTSCIGGQSTPIIPRPEPVSQSVYESVASPSWNSYLNAYIITFTSRNGFYIATSSDTIHFNTPQLMPPYFSDAPTNGWFGYLTMISPSSNSSMETNQTGYVYYAKKVPDSSHHMYRRPFTISIIPSQPTSTLTPTSQIRITPDFTPTPTKTLVDTTPPSITILNPKDGTDISGTSKVSITVSAKDNTRIAKVEIYIDGILRTSDSSTPYKYNWNTNKLRNGKHTIKAIAYDAAGNSSSHQVTVSK